MSKPPPVPPYRRAQGGITPSPPAITPPQSHPPVLTLPLKFAFNDEGSVQPHRRALQPSTHHASSKAGRKYVGMNSSGVSYYSSEMPFLNLFKAASTNEGAGSGHPFNTLASWCTFNSTAWQTNESAYLQLDHDGYPTSLTAKPTPPGGQLFTGVQAWMCFNEPYLAPNASSYYPGGSYTLSFQGCGTVLLGGGVSGGQSDVSTSGYTASTGIAVTASGRTTGTLTLVSTLPTGTIGTVTFLIPSPTHNGITLQILALPDPNNHIRGVSIVQTAYMQPFTYQGRPYPGYLAGQLFHPLFLDAFRMFSRFRAMDWLRSNGCDWGVAFTADLAKGATSGTIKWTGSVGGIGGQTYAYWPRPSGVYPFVFATQQIIAVTCTMGQAAVSWSTPLSAAVSTKTLTTGEMAFWPIMGGFEERPLLSNAHWTTARGVPLEACLQLGQEMDVDIWLCLPPTTCTVTALAYAKSTAQLAYDGTGAVLGGSNLTAFTGLSASHRCYVEYGNEVWGTYAGTRLLTMMGIAAFPGTNPGGMGSWGQGQEWMGTQVAGIGDLWYDVYGAASFDRRVVVSMPGQYADGTQANLMTAMNTPDWSSRAHTHHVTAVHVAPYWSLTQGSTKPGQLAEDAAVVMKTADPVSTLFALAYTNTVDGHTYPSIAPAGYIGVMQQLMQAFLSKFKQQEWWGRVSVLGYESGDGLGWWAMPAGWDAVMERFHRDERFGLLYYDGQGRLGGGLGRGYLAACEAAGFESVNQYNDVGFDGAGGQWGVLESIMQPVEPLAKAPAKYQGFANYIASGTRQVEPTRGGSGGLR